jgi:transcriptional regulator with XRE-family HTH domain
MIGDETDMQKDAVMISPTSTITRYIDELNQAGCLTGTDIANIAEVSKATVSRWKSGAIKPHPRTQLVLSDLYYIVDRLREYYTADEIRIWLYARHPQLDGARAIDLINQNKSEDVLRILDRLDAEVYL